MKRDDLVVDPQAEARQAAEALAAHRRAMVEHQAVVAGFDARIARRPAQDAVALALARQQDFQHRRTALLGEAFVKGSAVDEGALDREEVALDKALGLARKAAEREAAGVQVLVRLRDEAASLADTEAKRARPLEHRLEVALANAEMYALIPEFRAVAERLARIRVRAARINAVADPTRGLAVCGVPNLPEVAQVDLPNPPPVGAPDPKAFQIPMQRLVELAEREIAAQAA